MHHRACLNRRDFLRGTAAGAALLGTSGLGSLAGLSDITDPTRAPAPGLRATGVPGIARIALVRTPDRRAGVTSALKLLDLDAIGGRRVVVKPNFNTADAAPGSTHNDTLSQLITELHERGARSITLGESSGPPATSAVMAQKGTWDLARDLRFSVVNFDDMPDAEWVRFSAAGTHWSEGFWLPRLVTDAEYLVSTCCLKTHAYGGVFTMSLKLSVGLTPKPQRRELHRSPHMRRMIAELNRPARPQLIVLDGVEAFTDGGPSTGERRRANVVLAGHDPVAVDAVGVAILKELGSNEAIMGRRIFEQEQIARAVELELGVAGPDRIQIVTPDADSRAYATRIERILALG